MANDGATQPVSRRTFLRVSGASGLSAGVAVSCGAPAAPSRGSLPQVRLGTPTPAAEEVLTFFTAAQAAIVRTASGRIIPTDENGPGAIEAGVVHFVDRQLSQGGLGGPEYRLGPYQPGAPSSPGCSSSPWRSSRPWMRSGRRSSRPTWSSTCCSSWSLPPAGTRPPARTVALGAPARGSATPRRSLQHTAARNACGVLTMPALAWALHATALWIWYLPGLYQAALADGRVHLAEHAVLLGTALLFWWRVVHPGGQAAAAYGTSSLAVFTMALQGGLLGTLMTFARVPWYPAYGSTT